MRLMLSSDDLHFFNALSKCETLAECARKLDVTPPAVTQRLKALEDRIGIRLIDRSGRTISLTDEGALVATTWVGPEADGVTTRHASPSWARTAPGVGLWKLSAAATPGAANSFPTGGGEVPTLDPNWDDVEINANDDTVKTRRAMETRFAPRV